MALCLVRFNEIMSTLTIYINSRQAANHDRGLAIRPKNSERVLPDCTFVAWYRCLYAPRTGGAYDSHHRTAGIAGRARRRSSGVAARGAAPSWPDVNLAADPANPKTVLPRPLSQGGSRVL